MPASSRAWRLTAAGRVSVSATRSGVGVGRAQPLGGWGAGVGGRGGGVCGSWPLASVFVLVLLGELFGFEVVEVGGGVGLGPDADFAVVVEAVVFGVEEHFVVEVDLDALAAVLDTQGVPAVGDQGDVF